MAKQTVADFWRSVIAEMDPAALPPSLSLDAIDWYEQAESGVSDVSVVGLPAAKTKPLRAERPAKEEQPCVSPSASTQNEGGRRSSRDRRRGKSERGDGNA